jgi:multicomponent Na+:H+ antiporter subunit F
MLIDMTMMLLIFFIFIVLFRLVRVKTPYDLLLHLNLMTVKLAMLIVLFAVKIQSKDILDIALTYSMIGFLCLILLSRVLMKGGRMK